MKSLFDSFGLGSGGVGLGSTGLGLAKMVWLTSLDYCYLSTHYWYFNMVPLLESRHNESNAPFCGSLVIDHKMMMINNFHWLE